MNPLNLVTDPEVRQMRIESLTVFPRTINDGMTGGSAHFVLPSKGYLSADSRIVLPALNTANQFQYPPNVGVASLITTVTLSTPSSGVIAQNDDFGELYANLAMLVPPERKVNLESVLHGVNYVMQTGSGSHRSADASKKESLPGQYRLQCDKYEDQLPHPLVKGNSDCRPNMVDGRNNMRLTSSASSTPQYSLALSDLFPGFFKNGAFSLPVGLIEEDVLLDIVFSRQGEFGVDERAVYCPSLNTDANVNALNAVGVNDVGTCTAGVNATDIILTPVAGNAGTGEGFRMLVDIANGTPNNFRVLDSGSGYAAADEIQMSGTNFTAPAKVHPGVNFIDHSAANNLTVEAGGTANDFADGDKVLATNPANDALNFYVTVTVDGGTNLVTAAVIYDADTNKNLILPRSVAANAQFTLVKADGTDSTAKLGIGAGAQDTQGLGWDPVFNYSSDEKIKVDTTNVFITTDIIYYEDGRMERDAKQMNDKGIQMMYTQFRHFKSTMTDDDGVSDYGQVVAQPYNRLLGFSNDVVRTMMFNLYPSGTQSKEQFPYYNQSKTNPLLLKYCSRASLHQDGLRWNLNVNSVPYFSSQLETDFRQFRELCKCYGNMFINKGQYQGWSQCRQIADRTTTMTDADPSVQPGFSKLESNTDPTRQYELSDLKGSVCNQGWQGLDQSWLRGMNHINAVSFKFMDGNVQGNGVQVGNMPIDLNLVYDSTYNPWYSGPMTLSLWGEVERFFQIKSGVVSVTSSSE